MQKLKERVNKLYKGKISDVTSRIVVTKNEETIREKTIGNNKNKVIEIAVRL